MSKALQAAQQQRLVVSSTKSIKNPNNSGQAYLGIGKPSAAVSEPTEALISPDLEHSLAEARQAREALIVLGNGLKQDWLDADHWLPIGNIGCHTGTYLCQLAASRECSEIWDLTVTSTERLLA